jgi:hypothetical protein
MNALDTFQQHISRIADKYRYKKDAKEKYGPIEFRCLIALRAIEAWRADLEKIEHETIRDDVVFDAVSVMILCLEIGEMAGREQRRISHPRPARVALQEKNETRAKDLLKKILAEAASIKLTIAASEEFGKRVHPGVCARLGVSPAGNWPSPDTIKRAVSKYKRSKRG